MTTQTPEQLIAELRAQVADLAGWKTQQEQAAQQQSQQAQRDRLRGLPIAERSIAERELQLADSIAAVQAREAKLNEAAVLIAQKDYQHKYFIPEETFAGKRTLAEIDAAAHNYISNLDPLRLRQIAAINEVMAVGQLPDPATFPGAQPQEPGTAAGAPGAAASPAGVGEPSMSGGAAGGVSVVDEVTKRFKGQGDSKLEDYFAERIQREPMQTLRIDPLTGVQTVAAPEYAAPASGAPINQQPSGAASPGGQPAPVTQAQVLGV